MDIGYDALGREATETRYSDLAGSNLVARTTFTYTAAGQIENLHHTGPSGTNIANYTYTYDAASRVTAEVLNGTATTYSYDNADQVTADGTTTVTYDANGNRNNGSYSTSTGNRLTTDGTYNYTYDDEGNQTGKVKIADGETWSYTYDHRNQLTLVTHKATATDPIDLKVEFKYDATGNRNQKRVDTDGNGSWDTTQRFALDGWKNVNARLVGNENFDVWADLDGNSSLTTRYFRGDATDQVFARLDAGTAYWLETDRLGSVRDVIDNSGAVKSHLTYGAFGNILTETDANFTGRYTFTSREREKEIDLQFNRARFYDPATGRWISKDPLGFDAGDSNLYRYVQNRHTLVKDPSGRELFVLDNDAIVIQRELAKYGYESEIHSLPYGRFVYRTIDFLNPFADLTARRFYWLQETKRGKLPADAPAYLKVAAAALGALGDPVFEREKHQLIFRDSPLNPFEATSFPGDRMSWTDALYIYLTNVRKFGSGIADLGFKLGNSGIEALGRAARSSEDKIADFVNTAAAAILYSPQVHTTGGIALIGKPVVAGGAGVAGAAAASRAALASSLGTTILLSIREFNKRRDSALGERILKDLIRAVQKKNEPQAHAVAQPAHGPGPQVGQPVCDPLPKENNTKRVHITLGLAQTLPAFTAQIQTLLGNGVRVEAYPFPSLTLVTDTQVTGTIRAMDMAAGIHFNMAGVTRSHFNQYLAMVQAGNTNPLTQVPPGYSTDWELYLDLTRSGYLARTTFYPGPAPVSWLQPAP